MLMKFYGNLENESYFGICRDQHSITVYSAKDKFALGNKINFTFYTSEDETTANILKDILSPYLQDIPNDKIKTPKQSLELNDIGPIEKERREASIIISAQGCFEQVKGALISGIPITPNDIKYGIVICLPHFLSTYDVDLVIHLVKHNSPIDNYQYICTPEKKQEAKEMMKLFQKLIYSKEKEEIKQVLAVFKEKISNDFLSISAYELLYSVLLKLKVNSENEVVKKMICCMITLKTQAELSVLAFLMRGGNAEAKKMVLSLREESLVILKTQEILINNVIQSLKSLNLLFNLGNKDIDFTFVHEN